MRALTPPSGLVSSNPLLCVDHHDHRDTTVVRSSAAMLPSPYPDALVCPEARRHDSTLSGFRASLVWSQLQLRTPR
jgi:hypothetical protein